MIRLMRSAVSKSAACVAILCALSLPSLAGGGEGDENVLFLPSPLKFEFSHRFSPWNPGSRYELEKFNIFNEVGPLWMRYANRAPPSLTGKQFQALPQGYNLAEFGVKRRWGSFLGFRSTGYNERHVQPVQARRLTGVILEIPKSVLGNKFHASFLHASPADAAGKGVSPSGSQALVSLSRDLRKGFKLETEWSHSWHSLRASSKRGFRGGGLYMKLNGSIAGTDTTLTYRVRDAGLANPAVSLHARGENLATVVLQRTLRGHKFSYSNRMDSQQASSVPVLSSKDSREHSLRWTYAPKALPQISATQTWSHQTATALDRSEENLRLSLNKSVDPLVLGFSYLRGIRIDGLSLQTQWERTGFTGDAALNIGGPNRKLAAHYESSQIRLPATSQLIWSQLLRANTRFAFWSERVSLQPVLEWRHQEDGSGILQHSIISSVVSALIKLPHNIPGTGLLLTCSIRRLTREGQIRRQTAGLTIHWEWGQSPQPRN